MGRSAIARTNHSTGDVIILVYSKNKEWEEYQKYLCYLSRDGWVESKIQHGNIEPLQGVTGLKFARVCVLP